MKNFKTFKKCLPFLSLFSLVFVRYLYYGFTYFYQLDDYIQYHNYTYFFEDLGWLIDRLGLLTSRPAAGLGDLYVWSRFFSVMLLAVALLSALYTASAFLLKAVFSRYFGTGNFFLVVFALLPLGFEGTYWVSASSRILCGLFFAALGGWLLQRYLEGAKWYFLASACLMQFLGSCFYEQCLVFSVALFGLLGLLSMKRAGKKALWGGFGLVNTALYFWLTSLFPSSVLYGGRMELVLPVSADYFKGFLPQVIKQMGQAFLGGGFGTLFKGFWRGLQILWQDGALFFALLLIALCGLFWWLSAHQKEEGKKDGWLLYLCGAALFLAPLAPFFILANPWLSLRGTVMSFAGLALMADGLFRLLTKRMRQPLSAGLIAAVALVFCVAAVSELHDYKQTTETDQKIAATIAQTADLSDPHQRIGILGLEPSYLEDQNFYYHEHIHGVTESDWALTGILRYTTKQYDLAAVVPLPREAVWQSWNFETNRPDGFDQIYYYNEATDELLLLEMEILGEKEYRFYYEGALFATVTEENQKGILHQE